MTNLPFAYAPMPEAYGGNTLWFTLRFVAPLAAAPSISLGDFVWSDGSRTEWVEPQRLAIGDRLLDGEIVARVEIGGQPAWKIQVSPTASRFMPLATLRDKVERYIRGGDRRRATLEWEGEPEAFRNTTLERVLTRLHAKHPLVAVVFQEGQFVDGEPLLELDDAALVARITRKMTAGGR